MKHEEENKISIKIYRNYICEFRCKLSLLAESRKSRGKYEGLRAARFEYHCCTLTYVTGDSDTVHLFVLKTHIASKNGSASFCGCKLKMRKNSVCPFQPEEGSSSGFRNLVGSLTPKMGNIQNTSHGH